MSSRVDVSLGVEDPFSLQRALATPNNFASTEAHLQRHSGNQKDTVLFFAVLPGRISTEVIKLQDAQGSPRGKSSSPPSPLPGHVSEPFSLKFPKLPHLLTVLSPVKC